MNVSKACPVGFRGSAGECIAIAEQTVMVIITSEPTLAERIRESDDTGWRQSNETVKQADLSGIR